MNILVPAALIFSAIIPIILLFYFMRPKRQERVVGSIMLWRLAQQDLQASRPWQRLRITPLLLLQLLAAIFIVLILVRPAIFTNSPVSGDTIIILQSSASMQANDVAPNRFESAKNAILDIIDALGPSDHLSLITMARTPQILAVDSQDKGRLKTALQAAKVTNQNADLTQALSVASSLVTGQNGAQVLVVGDGHILNQDQMLAVPFPVRYMSIGTDTPNAALMALSSRVVQGKLTALAQVANYSHQKRSIPVELYADSKLVGVKTITLAPGTNSAVQWETVPSTARFLHARLLSQDAMTADHEAWAIVGSSIQGRVLLVTPGNKYLETALRLQPNVSLFETTPDKYASTLSYDLTVFDGLVPPTLPDGNIFFVNPPAGSYIFGSSAPAVSVTHISPGNDTINLLTDVDLSSIHAVHATHQLKPALWAQTIINAPETPLLLAGENSNRRIAVLGFDLHESDLPLSPSFPILMHNMANWLLPAPVIAGSQVVAGTPLTLQTWPGADRVTITDPNQQATTVGPPFPVTPYAKTNSIGIYQVIQHMHNRTLNGAFAINLFNPTQSNLPPARALPVLHSTNLTTGGNTVSRQLREIWPWIAAILLLILCIEWWFFSRTYKQQSATTQRQGTDKRRLTTTSKRTFIPTIRENLYDRYTLLRKRTGKLQKRFKGQFKKQLKEKKRANI